jgi:hypothetical protein
MPVFLEEDDFGKDDNATINFVFNEQFEVNDIF